MLSVSQLQFSTLSGIVRSYFFFVMKNKFELPGLNRMMLLIGDIQLMIYVLHVSVNQPIVIFVHSLFLVREN